MAFPTYRRDTIEVFLAMSTPAVRRLIPLARQCILAAVPHAVEKLRQGWGLLGYNAPAYFAFLAPMPDHLRIGFEWGIRLPDPAGLLRGEGTQVRHVEIRSAQALTRPALAALLREAAAFKPPKRPPRQRGEPVLRTPSMKAARSGQRKRASRGE